jgi:alanine dehydrogenase
MKIGVPKEIKDNENRVGITPAGASTLVQHGHEVVVERDAGAGCGFVDADYREAGTRITDVEETWNSELVIKIKEPLEAEYGYLNGQIVFAYFHLAGVSEALTERLLDSRTTAVAYETIEDETGKLPLLAPMSAVAGNMAPVVGSYYLARFNNGRGMQLGEVLGKRYGKATVIGDGVVGRHAARVAGAMGTRVVIFGRHPERAEEVERLAPNVEYGASNEANLQRHLPDTDLLVGAALIRGARISHLVSDEMVSCMPKGSVVVDVSIDQGGCVATSRPTSHSDPVFIEHDVTHYCVTNMPGAYPRTSTFALTEATLPYAVRIADGGLDALLSDPGFATGINTYEGHVTCCAVAEALELIHRYRSLDDIQH